MKSSTVVNALRALVRNRRFHHIALLALLSLISTLIGFEFHTSWLQARSLAVIGKYLTFRMQPGPTSSAVSAPSGPYDERLGYVFLPRFIDRLSQNDFAVAAQVRPSAMLRLANHAVFAPYREKTQAGLVLLDREGRVLYNAAYPKRVYTRFESIPEPIVNTLLFIENRELLDERFPYRNPAVEWDRLAKAIFQYGVTRLMPDRKTPGGSTLATQIEKYRHSPDGRTDSAADKLQQIASASVRAYLDGARTQQARRQIVLDYINSIPLGGIPGYGEIMGLGDGLWAWYNTDLETVGAALARRADKNGQVSDAGTTRKTLKRAGPDLTTWGLAYKQVLSLLLAQRRPWFYLVEHPDSLDARTKSYLRVLAAAGLLTPQEYDAARKARLKPQQRKAPEQDASFSIWKTANAVRPKLLTLLDIPQFYALDRMDLTVQTTLDHNAQEAVTQTLLDLRVPANAEKAGLHEFRLLERGDPSKVIYSLTLYERGDGVNRLRVQTDNFDQPLNINEGIKLEMGSSAKLRTFITYLEIIADLHDRLAGLSPDSLATFAEADRLTQWAVRFLSAAPDTSLAAMLDAALDRMYSANPKERFFTGGGVHTFSNFESSDDGQIFTVREALYKSVNLVFVRLMRDIVNHYIYQHSQPFQVLDDPSDPRRQTYLTQFADQEGRTFQNRFYKKYQGQKPEKVLETLIDGLIPTPRRLAIIFRTVRPGADLNAFAAFMQTNLPESPLASRTLRDLYDRYAPDAYSLVDRAFLAHIHPLELWTVAYLYAHPKAPLTEVINASAKERQNVYTWLFKTHRKYRQDKRIRIMLEIEAFQEIHRSWKRLRYPFDALVPSYATALGSSADRPAALAELMGILINNGMYSPAIRVESLWFAAHTPYETFIRRQTPTPERVLRPEIAERVKRELTGVVEKGTGQRVKGAFRQTDGKVLPVAGKTGTGDNRHERYGSGGHLIKSWVVNRTATFVFMVGDRYFGTITAYVAGSEAAQYKFTSALPVQVLKILAPKLMPLIEGTDPARQTAQTAFRQTPLRDLPAPR